MCDNVVMLGELWWDDADAEYIRTRSDRYPGATNIEPSWTQEAATDPRRIVRDPDPKSRIGAVRLIGYSPTAGFVLTVIMDTVDQAGITAWKTRGSDLRDYLEGKDEI
jgi:hypothetical protein